MSRDLLIERLRSFAKHKRVSLLKAQINVDCWCANVWSKPVAYELDGVLIIMPDFIIDDIFVIGGSDATRKEIMEEIEFILKDSIE